MLVLVVEGLKRRARRPAARPMPRRRPARRERRTHGYEQRALHLSPSQPDKSGREAEEIQSHFLFRFLGVFECSVKPLIFDRDLSFLFFFTIDWTDGSNNESLLFTAWSSVHRFDWRLAFSCIQAVLTDWNRNQRSIHVYLRRRFTRDNGWDWSVWRRRVRLDPTLTDRTSTLKDRDFRRGGRVLFGGRTETWTIIRDRPLIDLRSGRTE